MGNPDLEKRQQEINKFYNWLTEMQEKDITKQKKQKKSEEVKKMTFL